MEFTYSVKGLIAETRNIAEKLDNDFIGLQHLLLAYNKFDESGFKELKLTISDKKELIRNVKGVKLTGTGNRSYPLTKDLEFVLKNSNFQRWALGDKVIEPKHLHLSILLIEPKNKAEYFRIIDNNNIKISGLRKLLIDFQFNSILRSLGISKIFRQII